ncbi:hypothetical protein QG37_08054 [Candidozyma auris]|nr:hypothetical protein QG37_08054 [[Candida] auris]
MVSSLCGAPGGVLKLVGGPEMGENCQSASHSRGGLSWERKRGWVVKWEFWRDLWISGGFRVL